MRGEGKERVEGDRGLTRGVETSMGKRGGGRAKNAVGRERRGGKRREGKRGKRYSQKT